MHGLSSNFNVGIGGDQVNEVDTMEVRLRGNEARLQMAH